MSDSFQIVCVSNRHLCPEEIGGRIYRLLEAGADMVILREKDLSEAEYLQFARSILQFKAHEEHLSALQVVSIVNVQRL